MPVPPSPGFRVVLLVRVHPFVYLVRLSVIWVVIHPRMVPTGWEESHFFHLIKEKMKPSCLFFLDRGQAHMYKPAAGYTDTWSSC